MYIVLSFDDPHIGQSTFQMLAIKGFRLDSNQYSAHEGEKEIFSPIKDFYFQMKNRDISSFVELFYKYSLNKSDRKA